MYPGFRSLEDVLAAAQRAGTIGQRPVSEVIEHARDFVRVIPPTATRVVDIGSGGGVPGLIIAVELSHVRVTMIDRRATRMDALTRGIESMGLGDRAEAITGDAEALGTQPAHAGQYDVAVCRGLGSPEYTAEVARPFLAPNGILIVSEPPDSGVSRWPHALCERHSLSVVRRAGAVIVLQAQPPA